MTSRLIERFLTRPKRLFILDGLGALFSAFLIGVVLVKYEAIFGIPKEVLYLLATIPVGFALFDLSSYLIKSIHISLHLRIIASLNIAYCFLSLLKAFHHQNTITIFGWFYLLSEIAIVVFLAIMEWKVSTRLRSKDKNS